MEYDPELTALLASQAELLEAMRRLVRLGDLLLLRATGAPHLTEDEARDAQQELDAMRDTIEQLDAMLLLRRQQLREM